MSLNIKTPEAHELAAELARLTGESLTKAVTEAIRERLERKRRERDRDKMVAEAMAITRRVARYPREDRRGGSPARGRGDRATSTRAHGSWTDPRRPARSVPRGGARRLLPGPADLRACCPARRELDGCRARWAGAADAREHRRGDGALPGRRALLPGVHPPPSPSERSKKPSGPSAACTSSQAEGPSTAGPAATTASPAPEGSLEPMDGSVRTASMP